MQNRPAEPVSAMFTFVPFASPDRPATRRSPRQMAPAQGRALETLAHAIEYLEDEAALYADFRPSPKRNCELEALAMLKATSRNLWASLPVREPLWRRWFHSPEQATVVTLPLQ